MLFIIHIYIYIYIYIYIIKHDNISCIFFDIVKLIINTSKQYCQKYIFAFNLREIKNNYVILHNMYYNYIEVDIIIKYL